MTTTTSRVEADEITSKDFFEGVTRILGRVNEAIARTPVASASELVNSLNLLLREDPTFRDTYPQVGVIKPGEKGRHIQWVPRNQQ